MPGSPRPGLRLVAHALAAALVAGAAGPPGSGSAWADGTPSAPDCDYQFDNAVSTAVGIQDPAVLMWLHRFEAADGQDTIWAIQTTFGSPTLPGGVGVDAGDPVGYVIYEAAAGGAPGALLFEGTAVIEEGTVASGQNQVLPVPGVEVTGEFFVGVYVVDPGDGFFPAPLDQSVADTEGNVWIAAEAGDFGSFDPGSDPDEWGLPPTVLSTFDIEGVWQLCVTGASGSPCPPPDACHDDGTCTFDGIVNLPLGAATLALNDVGNLVVRNVGDTGLDGVVQEPLPANSAQMTTGLACPNFLESVAGSKAVFKMFADLPVPDGHVSTLTVENVDGDTLIADADFSPIGAKNYVIQTFIGETMTGNFVGLPSGVVQLPKVDLNEVSCFWDGPNFVICYKVTWVVDVTIPGDARGEEQTAKGDIIWVIDPDGPPCVPQTKIETFLTNTGPVEMTYQYAGPTAPIERCGPGPGFGRCCEANLTYGCNDAAVCECVCEIDPYCCFVQWDAQCAKEVQIFGCDVCEPSDCCTEHPGVGCDDGPCSTLVCAIDPFCCDVAWDGLCAIEAQQFCEVCGGGGVCIEGQFCAFDDIVNVALGQAQLHITPQGSLLVDNIGSSGQDGVAQDPLPPGSVHMVSGMECPNFALAEPGTEARFLMFGDVPDGLVSELNVSSPDGEHLVLDATFAPVGVTAYTVQVMIGPTMIASFKDLPSAVITIPKLDINEVDCRVDNPLHISAKLTCVTGIEIEGVSGTVDGDVVWIIGQNPRLTPTVQTSIVNLFKDTGPVELTFEFAGPSTPPLIPCGPAPGVGCCFGSNITPGCDDAECCFSICEFDPFCCISLWDQSCADLALEVCAVQTGACLIETPTPCPGDLTDNGSVGVDDLLILLAAWGPCADCNDCPADLTGSCAVGVDDLLILLANWGPCPPPSDTCTLLSASRCAEAGGIYQGDGTDCP